MERKSGNKRKKAAKTKPGRKKKKLRRWIWALFLTAAAGVFCAMAAYVFILVNGHSYLNQNLAAKIDFKETSIIYDRKGSEAAKLFVENREYVDIDEMPELLKQAFIATEDRRFEQHEGVDYIGIGRAIVKDIIARKAVEGASTITQQLARNLFLTNEKTFFRKATEMSIAMALENKFTKDEILELYLNRIFFGKASYGIKAASKTYFGKDDLNELTLGEIATLAGIPKAPSYYNPIDNKERAKVRRDTVLYVMAEQNVITQEQKTAAQDEPIEALAYQPTVSYPSFVDYVIREVQNITDITEEELYNNGYQIYTTMDVKAQQAMEEEYNKPEHFPADGPEQIVQSSMVILDNENGGIVAMIGGRDYARKGLNRAIIKRQPGSAFKPIASFAPAIESGDWQPYSLLSNEKKSFNGYSPSNMNNQYSARVTMMEAVRKSINIPAVWLLNEIGVAKGLDFARELGIELSPDDRNLSIALGGLTNGASPLEMARAYSAFATGGKLYETYAVARIVDKDGKDVYVHDAEATAKQVMSEKTAWYTTLLLKDVVARGTGTKANIKNHETAGKTGTTQSGLKGVSGNRDIWFVGYTKQYSAAVWMGFDRTDKEHVLKDYSGTAASLFAKVMTRSLGNEKTTLSKPDGVSNPVKQATPVKDLSAVYSPEQHQIELRWSGTDSRYVYRLYRKSDADEQYMELVISGEASYLDIAIEHGRTYEYYVIAYDPDLDVESEPSNSAIVTLPEAQESEMGEGTHMDPNPEIPEDPFAPFDPAPVNPEQSGNTGGAQETPGFDPNGDLNGAGGDETQQLE